MVTIGNTYVAIATILDDLTISPQHLIGDSFRFLRHAISNALEGLRSEDMNPDNIKSLEINLWRTPQSK